MTRMDADWIINVLKDLQAFAEENGLNASSRALEAAGVVVSEEVRRLKANPRSRRSSDQGAVVKPVDAQPRPAHFRRTERPASPHPMGSVSANGGLPPVRLVASNGERIC